MSEEKGVKDYDETGDTTEQKVPTNCPSCGHFWDPNSGLSFEEWLNSSNHCYGLY
jgi:hypothetical protein